MFPKAAKRSVISNQTYDKEERSTMKNDNDDVDNNCNVLNGTSAVLENTKILTNIFKYMPLETILTSRTVCQKWNTVICSNFYQRCIVTIENSIEKALAVFSYSSFPNKLLPTFSSFRFLTASLDNSTEVQIHFWEQFGERIRSLELLQHSLGPVAFLEVLLACPNLEELTFICGPIYENSIKGTETGELRLPVKKSGTDNVTKFSQRLLPYNMDNNMKKTSIMNSLTSLKIMDSNQMPQGILLDLIQWAGDRVTCLRLMDESHSNFEFFTSAAPIQFPTWDIKHVLVFIKKQAKVLTKLELTGLHIMPEHIKELAKMKNLKLQVLILKNVQVDTSSIISLLRRQKNLEELDLSYTGISERAFLHHSCTFFKLKKLSLAGYTSNMDFFSFLSRMTNLIELNLSEARSHSMTWDNLIHSFLPTKLKKLTKLDLSYNINLGSLRKQALFHSFMNCIKTNLVCLNLSCNTAIKNTLLQILWRELTQIKILFLEALPNVTDEGFTGIRQNQLQGTDWTTGRQNYMYDASLLRRHNRGTTHIGLCQQLETLSIANNAKLTDFVTQFGIRFLPNLKQIKMPGCIKITDRSLFFLAGSCRNLEYIDLRGCKQVTTDWMEWAIRSSPSLKAVFGQRTYFRPLSSEITSPKQTQEEQKHQGPELLDNRPAPIIQVAENVQSQPIKKEQDPEVLPASARQRPLSLVPAVQKGLQRQISKNEQQQNAKLSQETPRPYFRTRSMMPSSNMQFQRKKNGDKQEQLDEPPGPSYLSLSSLASAKDSLNLIQNEEPRQERKLLERPGTYSVTDPKFPHLISGPVEIEKHSSEKISSDRRTKIIDEDADDEYDSPPVAAYDFQPSADTEEIVQIITQGRERNMRKRYRKRLRPGRFSKNSVENRSSSSSINATGSAEKTSQSNMTIIDTNNNDNDSEKP